MTREEFIKRYHNYSTQSKEDAIAEVTAVNEEGITDDYAIAVRFGDLGYALTLQSSLQGLLELESKTRSNMERHLQLIVTGPKLTPLSQDYPVEIECATITVDLLTGEVTLPGGFVCSLNKLFHVVSKARQTRSTYMFTLHRKAFT